MYKIRNDFDLKKLSEVDLDISALRFVFKIWKERNITGAYVKIIGKYGYGSGGDDDAKYIRWMLNQLFDHPDYWIKGFVVDATELEYEWGDSLDLDPPKDVPFRLVINEEQKKPYTYVVEEDKIRFHLKTALAEVNDEMKKI